MKLLSMVAALAAAATVALSSPASAAPLAAHEIVHRNPLTSAHFAEHGSFEQGVEIFARHFPSAATLRRRLLQADPTTEPGADKLDAAISGPLASADTECINHLTQVRDFFETGGTEQVCQQQRDHFDGFDTMTKDELTTKVGEFCAADGCGPRMRTGFLKLARFCGDDLKLLPTEIKVYLKLVTARVSAICSTDRDNNYCLPTIKSLRDLGPKLTSGTVVKADLDASCTKCTVKLVSRLRFWLGGNSDNEKEFRKNVAMLTAICMKPFVNEGYCFLKFKEMSTEFSTAGDAGDSGFTDSRLNLFCSPCVNAFATRLALAVASITDQSPAQVSMVSAVKVLQVGRLIMCSKNAAGFCLPQLQAASVQAAAVSQACGADVMSLTTCSPACKAAIIGMRTRLGCCFGPLLMGSALADPDPTAKAMAIRAKIKGACDIDPPMRCNRKRLAGAVIVRNLRRSWCAANLNECVPAIKNDIASRLNVQPESIVIDETKLATDPECTVAVPCTVTEEMLADTYAGAVAAPKTTRRMLLQTAADEAVGGLIARVSVETSDDDDITAILTQSVSNIDLKDMTMPDSTALPDDAKLDYMQEVSVNGQPEVLEVTSENAAEVELADALAGASSPATRAASSIVAAVVALVVAVLAF